MTDSLSRRDFFKGVGAGTIDLGYGVSLCEGIYQYAGAVSEDDKHALLMKGSVNFMVFVAKEITPNDAKHYRRAPVTRRGESCIGIFMREEWNSDGCSYSSSLF